MTFSCFRFFIPFFLVCMSVFSQKTDIYWQPEVVFNYSPPSRWSFNFELTNRNLLNNTQSAASSFKEEHLEFSHFTSYESGFYSKLSLGVRYRNRDWLDPERGNEFRLTQQYNYSKPYNQLRLGHRVRIEQRFYENETVFRTRYRLSADLPLQGLTLNLYEFYVLITTEVLYSLSAKTAPELDQRFTTGLGYQLTNSLTLQVSIEYRHENYLNGASRRVFGYTSAIFKL
ncbi:MAG TPA: DUF2490 domain-containing protein [Leeuwenhoekiella sp.]|nr:DUF2490 domain-containing protein [Leeuwenhoekiella sp.]